MSLIEIQTALFFTQQFQLDYSELYVDFKRDPLVDSLNLQLKYHNVDNPDDAPAEFPRYQISSNNGKFKVTFFGNRCDIAVSTELGYTEKNQSDLSALIFKLISEKNVKINRIGHVSKYLFKNKTPSKTIKLHFLKLDNDEDVIDADVTFGFRNKNNISEYNEIYTFSQVDYSDFNTGISERCVLVTQDYNTIKNNENNFTSDDYIAFISSKPNQKINKYLDFFKDSNE